MGLFDFFTGAGRRRRFARRVMARLTKRGWAHPMAFDEARFVLDLGGDRGRIWLGDMFQEWSRYATPDQNSALERVMAHIFERGPPPPFEEAKALLVPVVRASVLVRAMMAEPLDDSAADIDDAWRPLCDHLTIHIAIDRPHSLTIVSTPTLKGWGVSFDQAFDTAMANLLTRSPMAVEPQEGGFLTSACNDINDIARLLAPDVFASLDLRGAPVVVAASRDCLAIAGADDPDALEAMARFIPAYLDEHPRPISYAPMILEGGEWRRFRPPANLPAMRALLALQTAHDYEQQLPLVLGRLAREGRPQEVGPVSLMTTDEGASSLVLWSEPVCLLPRADFVVLRTGKGATLARAWADVEAACGGLALEPDTASPYHLATGWPDAAAMERIAAAPEPAWAQGKGLGVVDGRLTMFG